MKKNKLKKFLNSQFSFLNSSGFTLIELLIVIVIITALAVTVFFALNPVKRVKDAHDSRIAAYTETILTSIHEYIVDNNGSLPPAINPGQLGTGGVALAQGTMYMIGTCTGACNATAANYTPQVPPAPAAYPCAGVPAANAVNSTTLATNLATYLKTLPIDPLSNGVGVWNSGAAATYITGYAVTVAAGNIIKITACYPEDTTTFSQSR